MALRGQPADELMRLSQPILVTLISVRSEADAGGSIDVVDAATRNVSLVESMEFDGWAPFELI